MTKLPTVTCVMTAFNYERFVASAIRSVLEQDYPGDLLDLVVVDDGSTDATANAIRAVQADAGNRVTLIQQGNSGLAAATQIALDRARGNLLAICDADDEWLPNKVRAQVDVFVARPEVTLVYGDMQVVDEHGSLIDSSFFRRHRISPLRGSVLDELVSLNFTTNSTLMLRAECVKPIPASSPYADYWLVMHAAAAGELELIDRPLSKYRLHSSNMNFGATGERLVREEVRELAVRRLILTGDLSHSVSAEKLANAALALGVKARAVAQVNGVPLEDVLPVLDTERALARDELERAMQARTLEGRLRSSARAALLDPVNVDAHALIQSVASCAARSRRTMVASAEELIRTPELVAVYCQQIGPQDEGTLVIVTDSSDLDTIGCQLRQSLRRIGVDPDDCPDMAVVPGEGDLSALSPEAALTCTSELSRFPGVPAKGLDWK